MTEISARRVTDIPFDDLPGFAHAMVDVGAGRLHVVTGGADEGPAVVLLAGFPETWYAWHAVLPDLARTHRVIALYLPGQGHSDRPADGYDTATAAERVRRALTQLDVAEHWIVSHDIGAWVAVPYALRFQDEGLRSLTIFDAGIPGVSLPEAIPTEPAIAAKLGHFAFHLVPELPELLLDGHEHDYVEWFLTHKVARRGSVDAHGLNRYGRLLAASGGVPAMLGYYRAAAESARQNRELAAQRRIEVPVLAVSSDQGSIPDMAGAVAPLAVDVTSAVIGDAGHFVLEEQPADVARVVRAFVERT